MDHFKKTGKFLMHYHQCIHCGHLSRREEYSIRAIASGIYPCARCGHEGPLNLVIQEDDVTPDGSGSSGGKGNN